MAKTVKAKVSKARQVKRKSKGACDPWEVWAVEDGLHQYVLNFRTWQRAFQYIQGTPNLRAPVIVHIDIPAMEY